MPARRRILFVAEAVTLAQVVRLATLGRALDRDQYEVHFASARFDELVFGGAPFTRHAIHSLSPAVIDARVASGRRLYGRRTLARYVRDERALFERVRPDLVIGDLRLSLAVSAAVDRIPYASLINAYWSPNAVRDGFPLPDHPIVRLLGVRLAEQYFPRALPFVFRHFARPVNALRRAHGLPALGSLPQVLNAGDHTLFPDVPALVPLREPARPAGSPDEGGAPGLPGEGSAPLFLGPVLWSPPVSLPPWWQRLDPQRPTLYVTLGSSGRVQRLPLVIEVAARLGFQVLVATAGRAAVPAALPAHVHLADFLPGELAARRSLAVVSNGGSTTGYQALSQGRPVLGIASNLDQYLAMTAIERAGGGLLLRAGALTADQLAGALTRLVSEPSFAARAAALGDEFARWDSGANFRAFVARAASGSAGRAAA